MLRFWCSGSSDKGLAVLLRFPTLEPYIRHLKDTPQRADDFLNGLRKSPWTPPDTDISTNKKAENPLLLGFFAGIIFLLRYYLTCFYCFCLLFWSPSCLKSSGRLLGTISTKFRANPTTGVQVISSNLMLTWRLTRTLDRLLRTIKDYKQTWTVIYQLKNAVTLLRKELENLDLAA